MMCQYSLSGAAQDASFVVTSSHFMLLDLQVRRVFVTYQQHDLMPIFDYNGFSALVLLLFIILDG
jgi:hypothetical protein